MTAAKKNSARLDARQLGEHAADCRAVAVYERGDWDTVWGPLAPDPSTFTTWRLLPAKSRTQRGVNTYCLVFICNSVNCSAKLVVRADAVLHSVKGIPGVRRSGGHP